MWSKIGLSSIAYQKQNWRKVSQNTHIETNYIHYPFFTHQLLSHIITSIKIMFFQEYLLTCKLFVFQTKKWSPSSSTCSNGGHVYRPKRNHTPFGTEQSTRPNRRIENHQGTMDTSGAPWGCTCVLLLQVGHSIFYLPYFAPTINWRNNGGELVFCHT